MLDKSLISGSTAMLILQLLSEKDMYGYEMIQGLSNSSNHVFDLKTGTLYPLLHSMELKGYLTSYMNNDNSKPRKYYCLTQKGCKVLGEKKQEWIQYSDAVRNVLGS